MNTLLFGVLLLTISVQRSLPANPSDVDRTFSFRVVRLQCLETPYTLIDLRACKVKLRRNQPTLFLFEFDMPKLMDKMYARFTVNYKLTTYQPLMIDETYEVCAALNQKPGVNPALDYVTETIRAHMPQAVQPCPYGGRYYNMSNFSLDEKHLPKSVPAGDYRIDMRVTDKHNVTMISLQCYVAVRSKGIAKLSMLEW
ncbi:hypothetical protein pipiens_017664 [Culex pipiens pipiens]|uniref:MD-2-related lipid-recognition domain-containing protein n=1 Tax=Culex pipiens pipiens TaxID=38569 RepID=A0ABD1CFJ7_CULPP